MRTVLGAVSGNTTRGYSQAVGDSAKESAGKSLDAFVAAHDDAEQVVGSIVCLTTGERIAAGPQCLKQCEKHWSSKAYSRARKKAAAGRGKSLPPGSTALDPAPTLQEEVVMDRAGEILSRRRGTDALTIAIPARRADGAPRAAGSGATEPDASSHRASSSPPATAVGTRLRSSFKHNLPEVAAPALALDDLCTVAAGADDRASATLPLSADPSPCGEIMVVIPCNVDKDADLTV